LSWHAAWPHNPPTSWAKGQCAIAIVAAAAGANADAHADANANAGVVVVVILPAIPPPIAAVEGVDRLRRATTIPIRPGILSPWLKLWRMVMSRIKTGYLFRIGKLVCRLKKGEKKVHVRQKTLDEKWNGFRPEWDDQKSWTEFHFFQSWNSWTKTATKSCIANQWKKYPNDRLLVQNLHTTKRGKNKKTFRLSASTSLR
jgi:hypothetical protein